MITILRAFCVVSCLISGIYASIIFYFFRDAKRLVFFAALCFCLFVNVNLDMSAYPYLVHDADYLKTLSPNVALVTIALANLFMSIYAGLLNTDKPSRLAPYYNTALIILAIISITVPANHVLPMYIILNILALFAGARAFYRSYLSIKAGHGEYIYPTIAHVIMTIVVTSEFLLAVFRVKIFGFRIVFLPFFLLFHGMMTALSYGNSIKKTQKLSASLSDTIERINHSNNALMCTQMKSEFLYRSLDLISKKCDEDPFSAEDLTVALSKYLRHTLNFQQLMGVVPLSNEIELTKAFVAIEKERYPGLKVEYKFPDTLPDFHIPPLSIQPLVENAIEHGFSETTKDPKVTLTIIPYRDYYHIDVSDNGAGMDEDVAVSLTDSLNDSARIGIYNIHTRLINLFGKGLVIQSAPGVGTSVSFVVPPDAEAYLREKGIRT
ncbi:MAG: histidine kinase [Lachnospiraceae bacterium]|nr:histidine kinase [Lachnospiraceae bacterium]